MYPTRVIQTDINGNGIAWNTDGLSLIPSSALTTTTVCSDQTNYTARGIIVFINTGTFGTGASAITVKIQGKDPVSGQYYDLLTSVSLSASSFSTLTLYPGTTATANVSASTVLPKTWRVSAQATAWGTGGSTVGIAACTIM